MYCDAGMLSCLKVLKGWETIHFEVKEHNKVVINEYKTLETGRAQFRDQK